MWQHLRSLLQLCFPWLTCRSRYSAVSSVESLISMYVSMQCLSLLESSRCAPSLDNLFVCSYICGVRAVALNVPTLDSYSLKRGHPTEDNWQTRNTTMSMVGSFRNNRTTHTLIILRPQETSTSSSKRQEHCSQESGLRELQKVFRYFSDLAKYNTTLNAE